MDDLIARLEQAGEGSRDLDKAIKDEFVGFDPDVDLPRYFPTAGDPTPHYTTIIDDARKLAPPDHMIYLSFNSPLPPSAWACCAPPKLGGHQSAKKRRHLEGRSSDPALALCIAAIKARLWAGRS
jgi:hypothetical protein